MKRKIWRDLISWKKSLARKPLILRGARQVGKTYILKKFGKEQFPRCHYFNFEKETGLSKIFEKNLNPLRILDELSFFSNDSINKNDLLIFDEIQNTPRALTSLKYFNEEIPHLAICAAGSLLGIQLSSDPFPVGKVHFLDIFPLTFEEFLLGIGDLKSYRFIQNIKTYVSIPEVIHDHLWEQLKKYFIIGGLPEIVNIYRKEDDFYLAINKIREKQNDLITAYIADMAKHSGKKNAMHIERLWRNVPQQLAKEQDGSAPKFKFKGIIAGLNRFAKLAGIIDWLSTTGLIIKAHIINKAALPFSTYTSENTFKLYLFDVGLLGALSNLSPKTILDYEYGSYKGYFAENFIAQEFLASNIKNLYCWKENTSEVEFVREVDGNILPIEVKSGWVTQSKSLKSFADKYNPLYRIIFSAKNLYTDKEKRIFKLPLYMASKFEDLYEYVAK